jgi:hypothetical protein
MNAPQTASDKILINCSHGAADLERATISLVLAVTASKTCETAVFMSAGAPRTRAFLAAGARLLA